MAGVAVIKFSIGHWALAVMLARRFASARKVKITLFKANLSTRAACSLAILRDCLVPCASSISMVLG